MHFWDIFWHFQHGTMGQISSDLLKKAFATCYDSMPFLLLVYAQKSKLFYFILFFFSPFPLSLGQWLTFYWACFHHRANLGKLERSFLPAKLEYKWCQFWSKVMTSKVEQTLVTAGTFQNLHFFWNSKKSNLGQDSITRHDNYFLYYIL